MKNIFILPTDEASRLYEIGGELTLSVANTKHKYNTGRNEKYRLSSISQSYKVTVEYTDEMHIEDAYNLEQFFLNEFKKYKYNPKIKFKGYTECLTTNPIAEYYCWFNNR